MQPLQLSPAEPGQGQAEMRRLNRLPIAIAILAIVLVLGVIVIGLSWRGFSFNRGDPIDGANDAPATTFADQLKRGIANGIIGDTAEREPFQPTPAPERTSDRLPPTGEGRRPEEEPRQPRLESEAEWKARLRREQEEQYLREAQRQRMARLQAHSTALDSPLKVEIAAAGKSAATATDKHDAAAPSNGISDLYSAALKSGLAGQTIDPNGQAAKEGFFNQDIRALGYLPNQLVRQISLFELKRGSVIPATMITGLNSDLPGRITAQVRQNVFDSATGRRLLIPQGAKLFGRYDSKVSFGQERVLVVWTDLIFPNGSTLQIGGMAGAEAEGYGGFNDEVDRHLWRTFGSAALVALIGTGIDMSMPDGSTRGGRENASDAARRNFAESFGRVAEQTISKNLNVQPTLHIRPGYEFNVLVDQDIVFPGTYAQ